MFKFITILFIQILCGMEMDLFIPSFPELQRVFNLSPAMVQLTVSANFIAFCICSLFAGALGDKYNRRIILIFGLVIFVLGSVFCVTAPNYIVLIFGRVLQGIGISAPAILSFPVLLEDCVTEKQAGLVGLINGAKTLAMAIAPVIGSLVNLYFNWRGNFTLLLFLGAICLVATYFSIPNKIGQRSVSLSLKTYIPLLKSQKFLVCMLGLSLLTSAYWVFMAMAPILYMEDMDVSLHNFGYYQGSLSFTFAIVCIFSPMIYKLLGQRWSLFIGLGICLLSAILILSLVLLSIHQPITITAVLLLFSVGAVFPINIIYPLSLDILPNTKGRSAGLGQAILLLMTACFLEISSCFYNGKLMSIGITMFISIMLSLTLFIFCLNRKYIVIPKR